MIEGTATHGVAPMWFVYVLFQVLLLAYGLHIITLKLGKRTAVLICLGVGIFSFVIGWLVNLCDFKGPFAIGRMCTAYFYFEIGSIIRTLDVQLSNKVRFLLIILLFALFYYGINQSGIICNLVDNSLGSNLQAYLIVTLAGTWLSWMIVRLCSILLPDVGLGYCLQYISKNAIVILPMHWWIYKVCIELFPECPLLLSAIVIILQTVISVEIYNCWFPLVRMKQ